MRLILCFLLFCLPQFHAFAGEVLILNTSTVETPYQQHIGYWVDHTNQAKLSEARTASYQPLKQQILYPPKHPVWFKLSVQSQALTTLTWIFFSYWTTIDWMDVWVVGAKETNHYALGDHRPYQARVIKSGLPAFPITLAPNERADIYIRTESMSLISLLGSLAPLAVFEAQNKSYDVLFGFFLVC